MIKRLSGDWHKGYQEALQDILQTISEHGGDTTVALVWINNNGDAETRRDGIEKGLL